MITRHNKLHACKPFNFRICLDPDEELMQLRLEGKFETEVLDRIASLMPDNGVFVDVGGCKGYHAFFVATRLPESKVFIFEPEHANYLCIKEGMMANQFTNVMAFELALGSTNDKQTYYLTPYSGRGGLLKSQVWNGMTTNVACVRLDDFSLPSPIDVMKIDVERAEMQVLESGTKTLEQTKALVVEMHDNGYEIGKFLIKHNFQVSPLGSSHIVAIKPCTSRDL